MSLRSALAVLLLMGSGCVPATQLARERLSHPGGLLFNGYERADVDCWRCHNGDGKGARGPSLVTRVPALSNSRLRKVIASGFGYMPKFEHKLTAEQVEQLIGWQRAEFPHQ